MCSHRGEAGRKHTQMPVGTLRTQGAKSIHLHLCAKASAYAVKCALWVLIKEKVMVCSADPSGVLCKPRLTKKPPRIPKTIANSLQETSIPLMCAGAYKRSAFISIKIERLSSNIYF
jgi:hypothetical protein